MLSKKFTAVAGAAETDPNFSSVSLLLHCDGTNGSQTFTDSSSSPKTVTANGNAQVSTSTKKYGTGSLALDGSGDYLSVASTSGQLGSGNFTVECWVYLISRVSSYPCIWGNYTSFGSGSFALFAGHNSGTTTKYNLAVDGSFPFIQSTSSITYNQWTHIAVVRNGTGTNNVTLYLDGVANGSGTTTATLNGTSGVSYIGTTGDDIANGYLNGYIDDFRITKGVARYTGNFTPPTSAFPNQ